MQCELGTQIQVCPHPGFGYLNARQPKLSPECPYFGFDSEVPTPPSRLTVFDLGSVFLGIYTNRESVPLFPDSGTSAPAFGFLWYRVRVPMLPNTGT